MSSPQWIRSFYHSVDNMSLKDEEDRLRITVECYYDGKKQHAILDDDKVTELRDACDAYLKGKNVK